MKSIGILLATVLSISSPLSAGVLDNAPNSSQQQKPQMPAHDSMMQPMMDMCANMDSMEMSGNKNKDFVLMMIPHHQSAVEMSEAFLASGGDDPKLVEMANKIIEAQEKEIQELKDWLAEHEKSQASALVN